MRKFFRILIYTITSLILLLVIVILFFSQADIPIEELKEKYAQAPSQFTNIMDMQVHFRDEGDPADSIPLVLLHGTSSSLFTWNACTEVWKQKHRIVRLDLPAFALTGPNTSSDYSISYYVSFLSQFLKDRKIDRCYLAGNSLGGLIAFQFAATYPEQVVKLILIDPAGYPTENAKAPIAFTLGKIPVINKLLTIVTPKFVVRKSIEDVYGDKSKVTDELVELYQDMACREGNRQALLERLKKDQQGDTTVVTKLIQPTLLLWGSSDHLIPVANAYKFQRDLPNDTLVILDQIGHVPMEETPDKVIPLVLDFIAENKNP